jgi:hypothetical protein
VSGRKNGHACAHAIVVPVTPIGPVYLTPAFRHAASSILWDTWTPKGISPKEWQENLDRLRGDL